MSDKRDDLIRSFVQKTGPRAGQSYTVKRGKSGLNIRVYKSGDTALAPSALPDVTGGVKRQQTARALRAKRAKPGLVRWSL